jgi:hypothetical protein
LGQWIGFHACSSIDARSTAGFSRAVMEKWAPRRRIASRNDSVSVTGRVQPGDDQSGGAGGPGGSKGVGDELVRAAGGHGRALA